MRRILGAATLLGVSLVSLRLILARPYSLTEQSERLLDVGKAGLLSYTWTGPESLVALEHYHSSFRRVPVRWEFRHGAAPKSTVMSALTASNFQIENAGWSPNGSTFLSTTERYNRRERDGTSLAFSSSHASRTQQLRGYWLLSNPCWSRDGRQVRFLTATLLDDRSGIDVKVGLRVLTVDTAAKRAFSGAPFGWPKNTFNNWDVIYDSILGEDGGGSLLVVARERTRRTMCRQDLDLFSVRPGVGSVTPKQWRVDFGAGEHITSVALSPAGDRLAWLTVGPQPVSEVETLLCRLFGRTPRKPFGSSARITRLDGRLIRSLGFEPMTDDRVTYMDVLSERVPSDVQWLPDGKHVSYRYRGSLYRIAVD